MIRALLLGLLLPVLSFADTIPKQTLYGYTGKPNTFSTASAAAAAAYLEINPGTGYTKESGPFVSGTNCTGTSFAVASIVAYYARNFYGLSCRNSSFTITSSLGCPEGYTPDSNGTTCTKPDADKCAPTKDKYTTGWVSYTGSKVDTGTVCIGGCNYQQNTLLDQDDRIGTDGRVWAQVGQTGLGTSCTEGAVTGQEPDQKNKDSKKPPCGATEGVLTTSTGKVLCVPEGTPDARKPGIQKSESKQTGPNGEVTTTEKTTTKDPQTGATHTSTASTTTNPDGTTKTSTEEKSTGGAAVGGGGSGDNSGNEPGQCAKEPDSPMCKKGTVKEKGQFDSAQGAKLQEAKDQLTAKFNEIKSAASVAFTASTASGSGTLPCPAPITVLGKPVSLCVSDYANQLSVIGAIIVFAAGIIAILLVVTA